MYALAKRLEGGGCAVAPPCWQWEVIGRLTIDDDGNVAELIATPSPSIGPVQTPAPGGRDVECVPAGEISVVDRTGLVAACRDLGVIDRHTQTNRASNPDGDLTRLYIDWGTSVCVERGGADIEVFQAGERYTVLVRERWNRSEDNCDFPGARAFELTMSQPITASTVDLVISPTAANPMTFECLDPNEGAAAVSIEDRTGLITGCSASGAATPDEPYEPGLTSTSDPPSLVLTWLSPCATDPLLTHVEFWYRESDEGGAPFLLVADRIDPDEPYGCRAMVTGRQVRITFSEPLSAADVDLLFTSNGGSGDYVQRSPHILDLDLRATKSTFGVDELVDVTAALTYRGREDAGPISGMSVDFLVQQLDGSFTLTPGITTQVCGNQGVLKAGESRTYSLADSYLVRDRQYDIEGIYDPDPFVLPPGVYYVHVHARLVIGEPLCTGESFDLAASILISVE